MTHHSITLDPDPSPAHPAGGAFFASRRSLSHRGPRTGLRRVAWATLLVCAGPGAAWACDGPAATLVSLEGMVEVRTAGAAAWQPARAAQPLCSGDTLAVRPLGRAAVVLPNEVVLRLDQGSVLTLQSFAQDKPSELGLVQGALHVLTRFSKRFGVITPYLNAMVDGTEFTVQVAGGATSVSVTEGVVRAENGAGQQRLSAGLSAKAAEGQAPTALDLRPSDAVRWALYFPQIVRPSPAALPGLPPVAQAAVAQAAQGQFSAALAAWPAEAGGALRSARASWLLGVGRLQDAEALLDGEDAAAPTPGAESLAVRALIQVVRNQPAEALATARRAVELGPQAAAPQLALSYAWQAQRELPQALSAAQRAVALEADHALAWARLAELQLSSGELRDGEASAQRASSLNPQTPRAQALLGFAQLLRGRDAQAGTSLQAAQSAAQADPLPHLGLGLLHLRAGRVAEGRREIEVAVMLDPGNAELRALLARAYLRESRDRLAGDELDIARRLDPHSPTPWFVDGMRKQRANRPVEAAADYERALALNDQRAVVRPNSLLDTDRAARTAALASVWRDLGFDGALLSTARDALVDDPQSEAAHRLLAEAYAATPRNETARVSELLQAQLRQSPRTEPVAPQELVPGLPVLNGPRMLALQETGPLFEESRGGARLGMMAGNRGLFGTSAKAWRSVGDGQVSFGHFHYETDGFRDGADIKLDANNLLWQTALTPELNGQVELRSMRREGGDITQRLLPESTAPERHRELESNAVRLGVRYAPTPQSEWLGSTAWLDRNAVSTDITRSGRLTVTGTGRNERSAQLSEASYTARSSRMIWSAGASKYREHSDISSLATTSPMVRAPVQRTSTPLGEHDVEFAYASVNADPVTVHLGLSRDDYKKDLLKVNQTNPKLGMVWSATEHLQVRAAVFRSVKGSAAKEQSIEPTQFAGFNQVFDDGDGTRSKRTALALDHVGNAKTRWGVEWSRRTLNVPTTPTTPSVFCPRVCDVRWKESYNEAHWDQRIDLRWALHAALSYETQTLYTLSQESNIPSQTRTWQLPLKASYFHGSGWSAYGQARVVQQSVHSNTSSTHDAKSHFGIVDAGMRYEVSKHSALMLDAANIFDREFRFQDTYLSGEPRIPLFQPNRIIMIRAEVRF